MAHDSVTRSGRRRKAVGESRSIYKVSEDIRGYNLIIVRHGWKEKWKEDGERSTLKDRTFKTAEGSPLRVTAIERKETFRLSVTKTKCALNSRKEVVVTGYRPRRDSTHVGIRKIWYFVPIYFKSNTIGRDPQNPI